MARLHFILFACGLAAGCNVTQGVGGPCAPFGTGESPCREQLYFPTGIAIDPEGDVLYVGSANADLRYSGGTVMAMRLARFDCAVEYARGGFASIPPGCTEDDLTVPDNCSGGGALIGLSENDHQGCRINLLDPGIMECDECPFVSDAVRIGNFSGSIRVQERTVGEMTFPVVDNGCPAGSSVASSDDSGHILTCSGSIAANRRLWLPVRGDPSITYIDVIKNGSDVILSCEDPSNPDPARRPNACSNQRITARDFHSNQPGAPSSLPALPPEPFGIALDQGTLTSTIDDAQGYARLLVAHLSGGEVTLINAAAFRPTSTSDIKPEENVVYDVHTGFFAGDSQDRRGAFAIAPLRSGDADSYWYVSSRINPTVAMFRVANAGVLLPTILPAGDFNVSNGPFLAGDDVREFAFEPGARRGFFLNDHPPSLFTVDTRIEASGPTAGVPRNFVVDAVSVCQGASHMAVRQWTEPGAEGTPDRQLTRIYVVCFTTGQVMILDPDLALVLDTVQVGTGANDIAFNFGGDILQEPLHRRAYVTDYIDMNVSIIDLDRGSPTENRVIARIGITSPPPKM